MLKCSDAQMQMLAHPPNGIFHWPTSPDIGAIPDVLVPFRIQRSPHDVQPITGWKFRRNMFAILGDSGVITEGKRLAVCVVLARGMLGRSADGDDPASL